MRYILVLAVAGVFFYLLYRQRHELPRGRRHLGTYLLALSAVLLTATMVRFPQEAFQASVAGLQIWWQIVFPALLPFFIFSQILIGLGVVHMMGVFLEPVMRPLFNVPGAGSFVMAMGLASGYPIGAILSKELRTRNLCNKVEAERLLCFTNTADPLFMFGAVAVGMLGYPHAGMTIAAAHYLSSITLGLLMRFYRRGAQRTPEPGRRGKMLSRAVNALIEARRQDGRPLGGLLGDAIQKSMETLLLVGGFIMLFSVIIRILEIVGVVAWLSRGLAYFVGLAGLSEDLAAPLLSGIFEIDLGCQYTSQLLQVPLREKVIVCGMIIAWSGLSVHAQVAAILSRTDISIMPFLFARVVHALLAGAYSALLWGPGAAMLQNVAVPVFLQTVPQGELSFWWSRTAYMFHQLLLTLALLLAAALLMYIWNRARLVLFYHRRPSGISR